MPDHAPPAASSNLAHLVSPEPPPDPWVDLRRHTAARIALGRTGVSLPTHELLRFSAAHAQARDAIHVPLDFARLAQALVEQGWPQPLCLSSQAADRHEYLLRPDKGRRLDSHSVEQLAALPRHTGGGTGTGPDMALVLGDGLSSLGMEKHAVPLLAAIRNALDRRAAAGPHPPLRLAPLVLVRHARVAVADEIGQLLGVRMVAMLLGERPGLSSPDSVGIYLTHTPRVGCTDAQRNCISNVRPAGQSFHDAAHRLTWLVHEGLRLGLTGVGLKDLSEQASLENSTPPVPALASP
jgi:ethanolamine ammonia-lyase small subunit